MSTEQSQQPAGAQPPGNDGAFTQEIQHSQLSARVPDKVVRGVFSNGVLVLQGAYEFALDFTQRIAKPHQVVARVVLPPPVVPSMIAAAGMITVSPTRTGSRNTRSADTLMILSRPVPSRS